MVSINKEVNQWSREFMLIMAKTLSPYEIVDLMMLNFRKNYIIGQYHFLLPDYNPGKDRLLLQDLNNEALKYINWKYYKQIPITNLYKHWYFSTEKTIYYPRKID